MNKPAEGNEVKGSVLEHIGHQIRAMFAGMPRAAFDLDKARKDPKAVAFRELSAVTIEEFGRLFEERKGEFSPSFSDDQDDRLESLRQQIHAFDAGLLAETVSQMREGDEAKLINVYDQEAADYPNPRFNNAEEHLQLNTPVGIMVLCYYAEVFGELLAQEEGFSEEMFKASLRSATFKSMFGMIGAVSGDIAAHTLAGGGFDDFPDERFRLDPGKFELNHMDGVAVPRMKQSVYQAFVDGIRGYVRVLMLAIRVIGGCPALAAKVEIDGKKKSVLAAHVDWVVEMLCEHYVPWFVAEKKRMAAAS